MVLIQIPSSADLHGLMPEHSGRHLSEGVEWTEHIQNLKDECQQGASDTKGLVAVFSFHKQWACKAAELRTSEPGLVIKAARAHPAWRAASTLK